MGTTRAHRLKHFAVLVLLLFLLPACGGGGGGGGGSTPPSGSGQSGGATPQTPVDTGGGTVQPPAPTVGQLLVRHTLLSRAVPIYVSSLRFTCLDANGDVVFGPVTRDKAVEILLTVPLSSVRLRIEYLFNGAVRGLFLVNIVWDEDGRCEVDDPEFEEVEAEVEELRIAPENLSIAAGHKLQLSCRGVLNTSETQDFTNSVEWSVEDESIAVIDENGLLSGLVKGRTRVKATLDSLTVTREVEVTDAVLALLQFDGPRASLPKGLSVNFKVIGIFSDNTSGAVTDLVWSSSNPAVATVDNEGKVTARSVGVTVISAHRGDIRVESNLEVTAAVVEDIFIEPGQLQLARGLTGNLKAFARFSDLSVQEVTSEVIWSSSRMGVATVSNDVTPGLLAALDVGDTEVRAQLGQVYSTITVVVTDAVLVSLRIDPESAEVYEGFSVQLTALGKYSDGRTESLASQNVWRSSDESVALVSDSGLVTGLKPGVVEIRLRRAGPADAVARVKVLAAVLTRLTIDQYLPSGPAGVKIPLTATGYFEGGTSRDVTHEVVWVSTKPDIAGIDSEGVVNPHLEGLTQIRCFKGCVEAETRLVVEDAILTDLFLYAPSERAPEGVYLQYRAEGVFSNGRRYDLTDSVSWSSHYDHARVRVNGYLTTVQAGSVMVTIRYQGLTREVPLEITDATLQSLTVAPDIGRLPTDVSIYLRALGVFSDGLVYDVHDQVSWKDNASDATVYSSGRLIARRAEEFEVTATHATTGLELRLPVVVESSAVVGLEVTPSTLSLPLGSSAQFRAEAFYENGFRETLTFFNFASSDASLFFWNSGGEVRGRQVGVGELIVDHRGFQKRIPAEIIEAALQSIEIQPDWSQLPLGLSSPLYCLGHYTDGISRLLTDLEWSLDTAAATVSDDGVVTSTKEGSALISARHKASGISDTAAVEVPAKTLQRIEFDDGPTRLRLDTDREFKILGYYNDDTVYELTRAVQWSSLNPLVAEVGNEPQNKGLVSAHSLGTTTLRVEEPVSGLTAVAEVEIVDTTLERQVEVPGGVGLIHLQQSPDGKRLYGLSSRALTVYSVPDMTMLRQYSFDGAASMDVSPDSSLVLVGHWDKSYLTAIDTATLVESTIPLPYEAMGVGIAQDGYAYAAAHNDYRLLAIDLSTRTVANELQALVGNGRYIRKDRTSDQLLLIRSNVSPARMLRFSATGPNMELLQTINTGGSAEGLVIHPKGGYFLAPDGAGNQPKFDASYAYTIHHFPIPDPRQVRSFMRIGAYPRAAAYSPSGALVYAMKSTNSDRRIYLYCSERGRLLGHLPTDFPSGVSLEAMEVSPAGDRLFVYGHDEGLRVFRLKP